MSKKWPWYPNLYRRTRDCVLLTFNKSPQVTRYRLLAHKNLDDCFTSPIAFMEAPAGGITYSPTVRAQNGLVLADVNHKDLTVVGFSMRDFYDPLDPSKNGLPTDDQFMFLCVQVFDSVANDWLAVSPIVLIPDADFFGISQPTLGLQASAPQLTLTSGDAVPPNSGMLQLFLPGYTRQFGIQNLSGSQVLQVAFGDNQPILSIPANGVIDASLGMIDTLLVASSSTGVSFRLVATIGNIYM